MFWDSLYSYGEREPHPRPAIGPRMHAVQAESGLHANDRAVLMVLFRASAITRCQKSLCSRAWGIAGPLLLSICFSDLMIWETKSAFLT